MMLLLAPAVANQPLDPEQPNGLVDEARYAVDQFLEKFNPGMDTVEMKEITGWVSEHSGILATIKDYRIVKPYVKWLADTAKLPDGVRYSMLHTLGMVGDTTAVPVVRMLVADTTRPMVRLGAAEALCLLGDAVTGTRVLMDMARTEAVPFEWLPTATFMGSRGAPVKLKTAADEKAMTAYFRWLAEHTKGANALAEAVTYLLQRDEESKNLAYRVAERALKAPEVYLPDRNDKRGLLGRLAGFGGERGKALAARYGK